MRRLRDVPPSAGLRRLAYRLPIAIYRARLGWILGARFLLLQHRGRRSGALRETVLEVVRSDRERGVWYVVSAWGERAQWLLNLRAEPRVRIETAGRMRSAEAREVSSEEAEEVIADYGRRHPHAMRWLARHLGWEIEAAEQDFRALASVTRVVELRAVVGDATRPGASTSR